MSDLMKARLLEDIRQLLTNARLSVVQAVNSAMVQTYWHIGRLIVEDEQHGQERAVYGKQQLEQLAQTLTRSIW